MPRRHPNMETPPSGYRTSDGILKIMTGDVPKKCISWEPEQDNNHCSTRFVVRKNIISTLANRIYRGWNEPNPNILEDIASMLLCRAHRNDAPTVAQGWISQLVSASPETHQWTTTTTTTTSLTRDGGGSTGIKDDENNCTARTGASSFGLSGMVTRSASRWRRGDAAGVVACPPKSTSTKARGKEESEFNQEESFHVECEICLSDLWSTGAAARNLGLGDGLTWCATCRAIFHLKCLQAWMASDFNLQQACPHCRGVWKW